MKLVLLVLAKAYAFHCFIFISHVSALPRRDLHRASLASFSHLFSISEIRPPGARSAYANNSIFLRPRASPLPH
jgi:hypothetical protein